MEIKKFYIEDLIKPNYNKKIKRKAERREQDKLYKIREKEERKMRWAKIREASITEFGD